MTNKRKPLALGTLCKQPNTFVARLILAELLAKRGQGPLQRRPVGHRAPRR